MKNPSLEASNLSSLKRKRHFWSPNISKPLLRSCIHFHRLQRTEVLRAAIFSRSLRILPAVQPKSVWIDWYTNWLMDKFIQQAPVDAKKISNKLRMVVYCCCVNLGYFRDDFCWLRVHFLKLTAKALKIGLPAPRGSRIVFQPSCELLVSGSVPSRSWFFAHNPIEVMLPTFICLMRPLLSHYGRRFSFVRRLRFSSLAKHDMWAQHNRNTQKSYLLWFGVSVYLCLLILPFFGRFWAENHAGA